MRTFDKVRFALGFASAMLLGTLPAPAQSQALQLVRVTIVDCWSVPLTSFRICNVRHVWVRADLVDEVMSGEINP